MSAFPEPCLKSSYCRSPIACEGWGYCRERNNDGMATLDQVEARRQEAAKRKEAARVA